MWNHAAMSNDASIEHRGGAALSREGSVLWVRIDRADERNSLDNDTIESLSARILIEEHRIYPEAIQVVLDGGWSVDGRRWIRQGRPAGTRSGATSGVD